MSIRYTGRSMKLVPPFWMLLRISWRNYIRHFDIILYANILALLPINIVLDITSPRHLYNTPLPSPADPTALLNSLGSLLTDPLYITNVFLQILASLAASYVVIAIVITMKKIYDRKSVVAIEVLREALPYLPKVVVAIILARLLIGVGLVALIIPGLILALLLSLLLPALIWHKLSPWQGIIRSYQTVRKNWLAVLGNLVLVNLIVSSIILTTILFIPDVLGFKTLALTIASVISSFVPMFTTVLFASLDLDFSEEEATTTP